MIVDYAHKPDAVEAAIRTLRPLTEGRVIVVIGAGGDRDPGKRPMMGEIAARLSDVLVITDDNPRTEDPATIRAAMRAGADRGSAEVIEIGDRRTAIFEAIGRARVRRRRARCRQGPRDGPGDPGSRASLRRPGGRPRGPAGARSMIPMTLGRHRRQWSVAPSPATPRWWSTGRRTSTAVARCRVDSSWRSWGNASTVTSTPTGRTPCSAAAPPPRRPSWSATRWSRSAGWRAMWSTGWTQRCSR